MADTKREKRNRYFSRQAQKKGILDPAPRHGRKLYATKREGVRGLRHAAGRIQEEWKNEFKSWSRAVKQYLEMRDDVVVGTLLDAIKLPLLGAPIFTEPAEAQTPGDQAAADWLFDTMNRMHKQSWRSYVSDCLDALDFGWALNEITLEKRADGRMWIRNLDPRGQETLEEWIFDEEHSDEVIAFKQRDPNSNLTVEIPLNRCTHITFRGRKGNPQGRSLLYWVHRPWRFAKDFENFEAIGVERDVGGMPVATLPEGDISQSDKDDLEEALAGMRRDENEYLMVPHDTQIAPYGSGNKIFDLNIIIERKKKEILMRMFAQFLMLGMQQVGTQALVQGSHDFFMLGLRSIQEQITEAWNNQLIPYLFSFNTFPGMTDYPQIVWKAPGKIDFAELINALNSAVSAKIFTPTDVDEDNLRELMDWPDLPDDERGAPRTAEQPPPPGIFGDRYENRARNPGYDR